jgi:hypothetical protein
VIHEVGDRIRLHPDGPLLEVVAVEYVLRYDHPTLGCRTIRVDTTTPHLAGSSGYSDGTQTQDIGNGYAPANVTTDARPSAPKESGR